MIGEEVIAVWDDGIDGSELYEVQKLVRCKECKYADKYSRNVAMRDTYQMYEKIDFCSYGEREGE